MDVEQRRVFDSRSIRFSSNVPVRRAFLFSKNHVPVSGTRQNPALIARWKPGPRGVLPWRHYPGNGWLRSGESCGLHYRAWCACGAGFRHGSGPWGSASSGKSRPRGRSAPACRPHATFIVPDNPVESRYRIGVRPRPAGRVTFMHITGFRVVAALPPQSRIGLRRWSGSGHRTRKLNWCDFCRAKRR